MAWFEVFIPGMDDTLGITLTLEAPNWIGALRTGLQNLGEGQESISNVMCDIKEDGSIHVTNVSSNRVFRLLEVQAPAVSQRPSSGAPAVPPAAPLAPAPGVEDAVGTSGGPGPSSDGSKTLLEFQRFDLSPEAAYAAAVLPAPSKAGPPLPPQETDETVRNPSSAGHSLSSPTSVHTSQQPESAEMSVPWTSMPPPSAATGPSVTVSSPLPPSLASLPTVGPAAKGYDITLQHAKAPAPAPVSMPSTPAMAPQGSPLLEATEPMAVAPAASPALQASVPAAVPAPPARTPPPAPVPAAAPVEATERIARAPAAKAKPTGPVPSPTARGVTAPPPKRSSGQFENAPRPVSREVSGDSYQLSPAAGMSAEAVAEAVADVFDATQGLLMEGAVDPARIAEVLLDIALSHVPAESGSFYIADVNGHELAFAAVRGPKADAIKKGRFTVPVGQGIVGFCALEGVCLRVSDIQHDPRHLSAVATAVGYSPRDTLCASAEKDGRLYGAVQLINATESFTAVHMEVLRYIGLTAAQLLERHFETT